MAGVAEGPEQARALERPHLLPPLQLQALLLLQELAVDLTALLGVLQGQQQRLRQSLQQGEHSIGSSRLYDLYWQAMKMLGVQ